MYHTTTPVASVSTGTFVISSSYGEAYITVKRNRVKIYGSNVFLDDRQEFEIELFNPGTTIRLAKILLNGKEISSAGIVLKPGQRVYLERFLDSPKKFKFETYKVDDSPAARAAIALNGNVEIRFYDEQSVPVYYNSTVTQNWYNQPCTFTTSTAPVASAMCFSGQSGSLRSSKSLETGRVEEGSHSNQSFKTVNKSFNSWISNIVKYKILPLTEKALEAQDLAVYCTECGTKNKKNSYKYCPKCGHKF